MDRTVERIVTGLERGDHVVRLCGPGDDVALEDVLTPGVLDLDVMRDAALLVREMDHELGTRRRLDRFLIEGCAGARRHLDRLRTGRHRSRGRRATARPTARGRARELSLPAVGIRRGSRRLPRSLVRA